LRGSRGGHPFFLFWPFFFSLSVLLQVLLLVKNVGVDELAYFVHMTWCFIFCIDHFDQGEIKHWQKLH
jgi:hypothetical protein